jgi:hypothetical protein
VREDASAALRDFLLPSACLNTLIHRTLAILSSADLSSATLRDTFHPRLLGKAAMKRDTNVSCSFLTGDDDEEDGNEEKTY